MKLSTNPTVWRVLVTNVLAGLVAIGVLPKALGDQLDTAAGAVITAIFVLLTVGGAIWSKQATLPVPPGSPPATVYVRDTDDVYRPEGLVEPGWAEDRKQAAANQKELDRLRAERDRPRQSGFGAGGDFDPGSARGLPT